MRAIGRALSTLNAITLLAAGLFAVQMSASARAGELQVGAAMRVITPNPLLPVSGGMGAPNPTREKKGDLTARAVVFRSGDVSVAIVCSGRHRLSVGTGGSCPRAGQSHSGRSHFDRLDPHA